MFQHKAFISSFYNPARHTIVLFTSFRSRSIALAVSNYAVAYRLFRFFLVFNWCYSTHTLHIGSDSFLIKHHTVHVPQLLEGLQN